MKTQFHDKILPTQLLLSNFYSGPRSKLIPDIHATIMDCCAILPPLKQFKLTISPKVSIEDMASNPIMLRLLEFIVRLKQPKKIMEIGTFIGLSAMNMASALPENGKLFTIEKFDHFAEIAQSNFNRNGFKNKIRLIQGDAFEKFPELAKHKPFDMIFIDGNKERYADYFLMADKLLAPNGLIIIDDSFFHGDALNKKPLTEKGRGVRKALLAAKKAKNYRKLLLPISNGFFMLIKNGKKSFKS